MPRPSAINSLTECATRRAAKLALWLALTACCAGAASAADAPAAAPATLDFGKVFDGEGGPRHVHAQLRYRLRDGEHQAELWRDGQLRVRRRTDERLDTFVFKTKGDPDWHMVMLDERRRLRTDIDRTNLYRVGHFGTDWSGIAHGLTRPVGAYVLHQAAAPAPGDPRAALAAPVAPCQWYALAREGRESRICWSEAYRLPMQIVDAAGQRVWEVTAVDTKPFGDEVFAIHDAGFVRNNASADISGD